METWLLILLIVLGVLVICLTAFLVWWFALRKKKDPDRNIQVTCSTCGTQLEMDKYNPPPKIVCTNCGKEGPVKF